MNRAETLACFKSLVEGAGVYVWAPPQLMADMISYAGRDVGVFERDGEFINDNLAIRMLMSEARRLVTCVELQIAKEVFEALQQ